MATALPHPSLHMDAHRIARGLGHARATSAAHRCTPPGLERDESASALRMAITLNVDECWGPVALQTLVIEHAKECSAKPTGAPSNPTGTLCSPVSFSCIPGPPSPLLYSLSSSKTSLKAWRLMRSRNHGSVFADSSVSFLALPPHCHFLN